MRTTVELPPSLANEVLVPPAVEWNGPAGIGTVTAACTRDAGSGTMTIEQKANLSRGVVSADDYEALLALQRELTHPKARTILVTADAPAATQPASE